MDEESRAQALRTLDELVLDAGQAVSYRKLASTLCLHVNRSKALLQEFVDKHATAHVLSVSMLVCGLNSGGGARTLLCPRADLETVRASLEAVLFEHVYAVSRASAALEGTTLATAAGDFEDFTPTIGAVASSVCAKHSQQEIGNLKINSYKSLTNDNATPSRVVNGNSQNKESSAPKTDLKVVNGSAPTARLTSSIVISGTTTLSKEAFPESAVKTKESNSTSKSKSKSNISSFFSKPIGQQGAKQVSKIKEEPKDTKPDRKDVTAEQEEVASTNTVTSGNVKSEKNENTKGKNKKPVKIEKKSEKTEPKKESTKKSVLSAQRHGRVDKKRKRVLHVSDSEDSDKDDPFEEAEAAEAAAEEDEDIIPATPNADVVKITSGIVNPKKRRKIIDKTYTTEDGYMVTRKEEVLESCSEDEVEMKENFVETNVKKEIVVEKKTPAATPKSKKKMQSPQKGKQASIMNFFKKKP